ncbi:MAG: T9SS C-terminal target domain-containing protein [Calditrichaeota bacterium]|nr:MAG: T9SS C-terminal target domain-containing protein [Calditrichota bacterium]MBL1208031.1 T9SS C-terminal target domain-containing protein [Calditrichota bacterium]NOG47866.1 T9SS type A sorting domain-containing protein [Calditrichota bacterium]
MNTLRFRIIILTFIVLPFLISAQDKTPQTTQKDAWSKYQDDNGADWKLRWNKKTGSPASMYGGKSKEYEGSFETKAKSFLKDNIELFDFENESYIDQLIVTKTVDRKEGTFVRLKQLYNNIPVVGGEYVTRFDNTNKVTYAGGYLYNKINLDLTPKISESVAIESAKIGLNIMELKSQPLTEVVILPWDGNYSLCWKVLLVESAIGKWECFVDAQNGALIYHENIVSNSVTKSGNVYLTNPGNGGITSDSIEVEYVGGKNQFELRNNFATPINSSGQVITSTTGNFYYTPPGSTVYDNTNFDYVNTLYHVFNFATVYIRDELGYTPSAIDIYVHQNYDNAYFDAETSVLRFGQTLTGDYFDFAKSNDMIYHEYTHFIIYNISGIYGFNDEKGAMSEGYADYFACSFTDDSNWAEWLHTTYTTHLRKLNTDPATFNYSNYDNISYRTSPVGSAHANGMIWSGALWDLRTLLGDSLADEIIFTSVISLTSTPTFLDGLNAILDYAGTVYPSTIPTIKTIFCNREISFPETPGLLQISTSSGGFVQLNWPLNTECNHSGYKIYRDYDFNGFQLLTTVGASTTSYEDRGITVGNKFDPKVRYKISAFDVSGQESSTSNVVTTYAGGINSKDVLNNLKEIQLTKFELFNAYPNPFNPQTNINFSLPEKSNTILSVYNTLGMEIKTLANGILEKGIHKRVLYASQLPTGIYIVKINSRGLETNKKYTQTQKIILIK